MKIIPVILAGGIGERFWPQSRALRPKQLLCITSKRTMIEETFARVKGITSKKALPLVITGTSIASAMKAALPACIAYDMLVEPVGKNTAPAIALAAAWISKKYGDSVMVVLPADHNVRPVSTFHSAVKSACRLAEAHDRLVVFGIRPDRPDTGYGYVHLGKKIGSGLEAPGREVIRFVEKPDLKTARKYLKSGGYFWNSGIFVWKTSTILGEFANHIPAVMPLLAKAQKADFSPAAIDAYYMTVAKESIDYGIMERSKRVAAIVGSFVWDDIGSWESLIRLHGANAAGTTAVGGNVFERDCRETLVVNNSGTLVAAVGLANCAVIATSDAVLVIDRNHLGNIKKYLAEMKSRKDYPAGLF